MRQVLITLEQLLLNLSRIEQTSAGLAQLRDYVGRLRIVILPVKGRHVSRKILAISDHLPEALAHLWLLVRPQSLAANGFKLLIFALFILGQQGNGVDHGLSVSC